MNRPPRKEAEQMKEKIKVGYFFPSDKKSYYNSKKMEQSTQNN